MEGKLSYIYHNIYKDKKSARDIKKVTKYHYEIQNLTKITRSAYHSPYYLHKLKILCPARYLKS
jgi:hypothetical protein